MDIQEFLNVSPRGGGPTFVGVTRPMRGKCACEKKVPPRGNFFFAAAFMPQIRRDPQTLTQE